MAGIGAGRNAGPNSLRNDELGEVVKSRRAVCPECGKKVALDFGNILRKHNKPDGMPCPLQNRGMSTELQE